VCVHELETKKKREREAERRKNKNVPATNHTTQHFTNILSLSLLVVLMCVCG
jgi:hypothetical protein